MNTRKRIILAVANGCRGLMEISKELDLSPSTVNNYFYPQAHNEGFAFENGDILQWKPRKNNTIRLADGVLCQRRGGRVVGVYGRVEVK